MSASTGKVGRLSPHFAAHEFACRHCGAAVVSLRLVHALEAVRRSIGGPVHIIDGYRCPTHNKTVGGAADSQHMYGLAIDPRPFIMGDNVLHRAGITGVGRKNGFVVHLDVRDGAPVSFSE